MTVLSTHSFKAIAVPQSIVDDNRTAIAASYSIEVTANQLRSVYSTLLESTDSVGNASATRGELAERSSIETVCRQGDFFPCRTEEVIAR